MNRKKTKATPRQTPHLTELFVLTGLLVAAGWFFRPDDPFFIQLRLSPYWLLVLGFSISYGAPTGVIAGLLSAGLYLIGIALQGTNLQRLLNLNIAQAFHAMFYVAAGIIVSGRIHLKDQRIREEKEHAATLRDQLAEAEARRLELDQAYRELERKMAAQSESISTFSDNIRQLFAKSEAAVYTALADILQKQLHITDLGIWQQNQDGLYKKIRPRASKDPLPALGREVLRTRSVQTLRDMLFAHQQISPGDGILAGPLVVNKVNLAAVVVVESIEFQHLNYTGIAIFETYLLWASYALEELATVSGLKQRTRAQTGSMLMDRKAFTSFCHSELDMLNAELPSCLLHFKLTKAVSADYAARVHTVIERIIEYQTHLHDAATRLPDQSMLIFQPATPAASAQANVNRILHYINLFDLTETPHAAERLLKYNIHEVQDIGSFECTLAEYTPEVTP